MQLAGSVQLRLSCNSSVTARSLITVATQLVRCTIASVATRLVRHSFRGSYSLCDSLVRVLLSMISMTSGHCAPSRATRTHSSQVLAARRGQVAFVSDALCARLAPLLGLDAALLSCLSKATNFEIARRYPVSCSNHLPPLVALALEADPESLLDALAAEAAPPLGPGVRVEVCDAQGIHPSPSVRLCVANRGSDPSRASVYLKRPNPPNPRTSLS